MTENIILAVMVLLLVFFFGAVIGDGLGHKHAMNEAFKNNCAVYDSDEQRLVFPITNHLILGRTK